jgi:hypothetical protein
MLDQPMNRLCHLCLFFLLILPVAPRAEEPPPSAQALKSFAENSWEKYAVNQGGNYTKVPNTYAGNLVRIHVDRVHNELITLDGKQIDGAGTIVGVIDSGMPTFFEKSANLIAYRDFTSVDPTPNDDSNFDMPHGTHVLGTIVGDSVKDKDGVERIVGIAPKARFVIAKVFPSRKVIVGTRNLKHEDQFKSAFRWMMALPEGMRPSVINCSWGNVHPDTILESADPGFTEIFRQANSMGILVVFAAGNFHEEQESYHGLDAYILAHVNVLTVGATDVFDYVTDFSGRGYTLEYGYPFVSPDIAAPGQDIPSLRPNGQFSNIWDGTSMAAPHISGVSLLIKQAFPAITPLQMRQLIEETAEHIEPVRPKGNPAIANHPFFKLFYPSGEPLLFDTKDKGEIDFSVKNRAYGSGIIDAYKAVKRALKLHELGGKNPEEENAAGLLKLAEQYFNNHNFLLGHQMVDRILSGAFDPKFSSEEEKIESLTKAYQLKVIGYRSSYSFRESRQVIDALLQNRTTLKLTKEEVCDFTFLRANNINDQFQYRSRINDREFIGAQTVFRGVEDSTLEIIDAFEEYLSICGTDHVNYFRAKVMVARNKALLREFDQAEKILMDVILKTPGSADAQDAVLALREVYGKHTKEFVVCLEGICRKVSGDEFTKSQIRSQAFLIITDSQDMEACLAAWELLLSISSEYDTIEYAKKAYKNHHCLIQETLFQFLRNKLTSDEFDFFLSTSF